MYISGGAMHFRGVPAVHHEFDEVWSLDPSAMDNADGWEVASHIPQSPPNHVSARCYNGLVAVGEEELWVIGGSVSASQPSASRPDDRVPMRSCWSYNTRTGGWSPLPDLLHARDACTAEYVAGRVWVTGGVNGTGENRTVVRNRSSLLKFSFPI